MNLPNRLTVLRIILTPFFFIFFFLPEWTGHWHLISLILVWLIGTINEITDLLDGYYARKRDLVTDIGKVLDPFADVLSRITYFICFAAVGIMPWWILIILIYRELAISFLRLLMISEGIAMAASLWGKLKAVTYVTASIIGMLFITITRLNLFTEYLSVFTRITFFFFLLTAVASVASFFTYVSTVYKFRKSKK